jgi:CubicO group peptidase (beta-lactamase class C family)
MKTPNYAAPIGGTLMLLLIQLSCTQPPTIDLDKGQQNPVKEASLEAQNLVDSMVEELLRLPSSPPGLSVAVGYDDTIIFSEGFGYSNLKSKKRVTPKTPFRAGSLSRMVTITALVKLIEKGALAFDDLVDQQLSNYPKKEYAINIKQLAIGLSGMPHLSEDDNLETRQYNSVEDALNVFSHIPLAHKPGDKYQYSIHGYTLLSRMMEKASNKDFLSLINDDLFVPLSLSSTGPEVLSNSSMERSELYDLHPEGINKNLPTQIIDPANYSYSWAGAGLLSTPTGLVKLTGAYSSGFVREDIVDTMFERQRLNNGDTIRQGIGWDQNWDMADRARWVWARHS